MFGFVFCILACLIALMLLAQVKEKSKYSAFHAFDKMYTNFSSLVTMRMTLEQLQDKLIVSNTKLVELLKKYLEETQNNPNTIHYHLWQKLHDTKCEILALNVLIYSKLNNQDAEQLLTEKTDDES